MIDKLNGIGIEINDPNDLAPIEHSYESNGDHGQMFGVQLSEGSWYLLQQLNASMKEDTEQQVRERIREQLKQEDWQQLAESLEKDMATLRHEKDSAVNDMRRQIDAANMRATSAEQELAELKGALSVLKERL